MHDDISRKTRFVRSGLHVPRKSTSESDFSSLGMNEVERTIAMQPSHDSLGRQVGRNGRTTTVPFVMWRTEGSNSLTLPANLRHQHLREDDSCRQCGGGCGGGNHLAVHWVELPSRRGPRARIAGDMMKCEKSWQAF